MIKENRHSKNTIKAIWVRKPTNETKYKKVVKRKYE